MEGHPDMKTNTDDLVVGVVALNGGNFVGRTRLQKTALLLDHCGVNSGVEFEYLHYGPYSSDLAEGWDQARLANRLQMEARTGRYEMPYTVFRTQQPAPERIGSLSAQTVKNLLSQISAYSDVVVELAATLLFLHENGYGDGAEKELKTRKPLKSTEQRLRLAKKLLHELGLGNASTECRETCVSASA